MSLSVIAEDVSNCTACPLHRKRKNTVPGEGPENARIVLVGEAPGRKEDEEGQPFMGPSGELLDLFLSKAGIEREEIFITNILKCRPPNNRGPESEEVAACQPHLVEQLALIDPEVVVTLGQHATTYVTSHYGQMKVLMNCDLVSRATPRPVPVIPVFHPSFLLRIMDKETEFRNQVFQDTLDRLREAKKIAEE